ncbi:MAG: hypothetical protein ABI315_03650 [Bacteroidia bacterium]
MKHKLLSITLITFSLLSCNTNKKTAKQSDKDNTSLCSTNVYTYQKDIQPIFDKHCNNCHSSKKKAGGYDFTQPERVVASVQEHKLLGSIKWQRGYMKMPMKAAQLDSTSIFKIECWVKNGMKQ